MCNKWLLCSVTESVTNISLFDRISNQAKCEFQGHPTHILLSLISDSDQTLQGRCTVTYNFQEILDLRISSSTMAKKSL